MCGQKRYLSQELNRQKRGKDEDGRGLGEERLGDGAAGEESMVEEEYQPSLPRNDTIFWTILQHTIYSQNLA